MVIFICNEFQYVFSSFFLQNEMIFEINSKVQKLREFFNFVANQMYFENFIGCILFAGNFYIIDNIMNIYTFIKKCSFSSGDICCARAVKLNNLITTSGIIGQLLFTGKTIPPYERRFRELLDVLKHSEYPSCCFVFSLLTVMMSKKSLAIVKSFHRFQWDYFFYM